MRAPPILALGLALALALAQQLLPSVALAQSTVPVQGELTAADGGLLDEDSADLTFRIFSELEGGDPLWEAPRPGVVLLDGWFAVELGLVVPLPADLYDGGGRRWLEVSVGDETLSPRTALGAAPTSLHALSADRVLHAQDGPVSNLGIAVDLNTNRLRITASDGSAFGDLPGDQGLVAMSGTVPGQRITLPVTGDHVLGVPPPGTLGVVQDGVDHGEDRPFFLYAVNVDDTAAGLRFGISPAPSLRAVAAGAPFHAFDGQDLEGPCVRIGWIRMRWDGGEWEIQPLRHGDGIGEFPDSRWFEHAPGQWGAAAGNWFVVTPGAGTAPVFAAHKARYSIARDGYVDYLFTFNGDGGQDGTGDEGLKLTLPYRGAEGLWGALPRAEAFWLDPGGQTHQDAVAVAGPQDTFLSFFFTIPTYPGTGHFAAG